MRAQFGRWRERFEEIVSRIVLNAGNPLADLKSDMLAADMEHKKCSNSAGTRPTIPAFSGSNPGYKPRPVHPWRTIVDSHHAT